MHQQLTCRIALVGIQPLRRGNEANAEAGKLLNAADAMNQGAAKAIQLPNQHSIKPALAGIGHQLIEARAISLGPAHGVFVGVRNSLSAEPWARPPPR